MNSLIPKHQIVVKHGKTLKTHDNEALECRLFGSIWNNCSTNPDLIKLYFHAQQLLLCGFLFIFLVCYCTEFFCMWSRELLCCFCLLSTCILVGIHLDEVCIASLSMCRYAGMCCLQFPNRVNGYTGQPSLTRSSHTNKPR